MSVAYIARTVQSGEYLLLTDGKVVAGPFATAAEAVTARDALLKAGRVIAGETTSERVANTQNLRHDFGALHAFSERTPQSLVIKPTALASN